MVSTVFHNPNGFLTMGMMGWTVGIDSVRRVVER
jgi:hypothetical protein